MATYEIVAGWTAVVDITLFTQGAKPAGTMSGMNAELVLTDENGVTLDTVGDVTVQDSANWVVRYTPDAGDLIVGTFYGRIKVTDSSGKIAYFPSGVPDIWIVRKVSGVSTEA